MRPGDTVAVVSPSGPPNAALLTRGVERLEGLGLKVVVGAHARCEVAHVVDAAVEQRIIHRRVPVEELFARGTHHLVA